MADAFATLPGPRYFEPAIETMPRSALRALQEEKLAALVPYVVERSPLHARLWQAAGVTPQDVRSLDDFTRLAPSFDVHALRAAGDPFGGLLCVDRDDPGVQGIRVNGGSNGPVADCYTTSATVCRDWWEMGVRRGDYVAYVQVTSHGDGMLDTLRRLGATVVPFDHHADDLARLAARSRALRPAMLYALSEPIWNAIPPLCAHLGLDPIGVFGSYRSIVYAGDGLTPPVRALAASWGRRVV